MLTATPLANLAFAEIEDGCTIGSSAIAGNINPDLKAKDGDEININLVLANTSFGQFTECVYRSDTVSIEVEGTTVCTFTFAGGLFIGEDEVVEIWQADGSGVAGAGNAQSIAGQCNFDTGVFGINGPWSMQGISVGVVFNQVLDTNFQVPIVEVPGSTFLITPTMDVTKTTDPTKARVDADNPSVPVTWTIAVENTSPIAILSNCELEDANAPAPIADITTIGPGDTVERQYVTNISDSTMNHVDVVCLDQQGDEVVGEAEASVVIYKPLVQIVKECDAKVNVGTSAECTLTVTNESPDDPKASLTNCVVTDVNIGFTSAPFVLGNTPVVFGPLATPAIFDTFVNTAEVLCEDQGGGPVFDDDVVTIIPANFAVNIDKNCEAKTVMPFDTTIDCTIDVSAPATNTGALLNCNITDPSFGGNVAGPFNLNPGAAWPTEPVSRAVTPQDVIEMVVENTATVTCSSQDNVDNVSNSDNAFANIFEVGATITDVCTPDTQFSPGTITWTVTICNTGPFDKGDATDLTINTDGEFTKDGNFLDAAPEKDLTNVSVSAGTCVEIIVTRDGLGDGIYKDTISGSASHQAGSFDLDAMASCEVDTPGENGCTPGFWKANAVFKKDPANAWTVEKPGDSLATATFVPQNHDSSLTLLEALKLKGGDDAEGMEGNLLRHCVAAKLNAENASVPFAIPTADAVIAACNEAMATEDRDTMEVLKDQLDEFNNAGCSINMKGEQVDPE